MTLLARARFFADSLLPSAGNNAAPQGTTLTVNFDLVVNAPPTGMAQTLDFDVPAPS